MIDNYLTYKMEELHGCLHISYNISSNHPHVVGMTQVEGLITAMGKHSTSHTVKIDKGEWT